MKTMGQLRIPADMLKERSSNPRMVMFSGGTRKVPSTASIFIGISRGPLGVATTKEPGTAKRRPSRGCIDIAVQVADGCWVKDWQSAEVSIIFDPLSDLRVTLGRTELYWEDISANLGVL